MLFDSFQFLAYQPGDETIDIGKLLENDSLLTGISTTAPPEVQLLHVYPNPVNEELLVEYSSGAACAMLFEVWDLEGRMLQKMTVAAGRGEQRQAIDVKTLSPGVYLLRINGGSLYRTVKFVRM
jgi:hypothetical protein